MPVPCVFVFVRSNILFPVKAVKMSVTAMKKRHDSEHSAEWRNWYILVFVVLLAQILFFTWFTARFS